MIDKEVWEKFVGAINDGLAATAPSRESVAVKDVAQAFPIRVGDRVYQGFFYAAIIDAGSVPDAGRLVNKLISAVRRVLRSDPRLRRFRFERDDIISGLRDDLNTAVGGVDDEWKTR